MGIKFTSLKRYVESSKIKLVLIYFNFLLILADEKRSDSRDINSV